MTATSATSYRPGLPRVPNRLRHLPVVRGYPVPWFVAQQPDGSYDFRVADGRKFIEAVRRRRCWICGGTLAARLSFVIGPMCAVNRTTAEPPCHPDCAHWAAVACPFLNQQMRHRRTGDLPPAQLPPGEMIERQAGATLVWTTRSYELFSDGRGGTLIEIGEAMETAWYAEGRPATRAEVLASIETGLPILHEQAEAEGPAALAELKAAVARAMRHVPAQ